VIETENFLLGLTKITRLDLIKAHTCTLQIAMRWRTKDEVISGKGQFVCGNKKCGLDTELRSWEVNFVYSEGGTKKNALVKLRKSLISIKGCILVFYSRMNIILCIMQSIKHVLSVLYIVQ